MADIKDVEYVFNKLSETTPTELNSRMNDTQAGIGAVLKILSDADGAVTCGDIAKKMGVSTARVAVLLKKMVAKNLICRSVGTDDARIIYISLTDEGRNTVKELRELITQHLSRLIDVMGMEKIMTFIELSDEMKRVAEAVKPDLPKVLKDKK
ncbi:MAG: MarR family transcriptional regulator [Clostridia bacterium]|nr:MarR family transcriptional regulator [Clostridia bacterium]